MSPFTSVSGYHLPYSPAVLKTCCPYFFLRCSSLSVNMLQQISKGLVTYYQISPLTIAGLADLNQGDLNH